jgi:hypothetical protein
VLVLSRFAVLVLSESRSRVAVLVLSKSRSRVAVLVLSKSRSRVAVLVLSEPPIKSQSPIHSRPQQSLTHD